MRKNKITICGLPYTIVMRQRNSRNDMALGRCDNKDLKIFIDSEMPKEQQDVTLIHEWIHAVLDTHGIEHTEYIANSLSIELYRVGFRVFGGDE